MELQVLERVVEKKSEAKKIRRRGSIPAIIYSRGKPGRNVEINGREFSAFMRHLPKGRLPNTILTLVEGDGKKSRVLVKDIQYNVTTYDVIHLDFEELEDGVQVSVKVPIECMGVADCVGIKHGGVLRRVIRHLKVRCLPKDIPEAFTLDVQGMELNDIRRLADLDIPPTVRSLANLQEVAVLIARR